MHKIYWLWLRTSALSSQSSSRQMISGLRNSASRTSMLSSQCSGRQNVENISGLRNSASRTASLNSQSTGRLQTDLNAGLRNSISRASIGSRMSLRSHYSTGSSSLGSNKSTHSLPEYGSLSTQVGVYI